MEKTLATTENSDVSIFQTGGDFSRALQMARVMSSSTMVPSQYQGDRNVPNVIVAMELAHRVGTSPFLVMQNLHVIQGRPSWGSPFLIAMIAESGRFEPLRFDISGTGDGRGCVAWTKLKTSGERLEGPRVDIAMAKAEGWHGRNGSKWKTMPEVMLRYRAAAFFARLYAYDLLCGLHTMDEVYDIDPVEVKPDSTATLTAQLLKEGAVDEEAEIVEGPIKDVEENLPSAEAKKDLWKDYVDVVGNRSHAINAAKLLTGGRGFKEWTNTDLKNIREDMERRAEEKKAATATVEAETKPVAEEKAEPKGKPELKEKPGSWNFSDGPDAGNSVEEEVNISF